MCSKQYDTDLIFDLQGHQVKHSYGTTSRAAPQVRSNHSQAMYHAAKSICRHKLNIPALQNVLLELTVCTIIAGVEGA